MDLTITNSRFAYATKVYDGPDTGFIDVPEDRLTIALARGSDDGTGEMPHNADLKTGPAYPSQTFFIYNGPCNPDDELFDKMEDAVADLLPRDMELEQVWVGPNLKPGIKIRSKQDEIPVDVIAEQADMNDIEHMKLGDTLHISTPS